MNLVLDAAEEVFGESSYADASVEDIAHRAEISIGTLYNLFHSKEDIYRAVVARETIFRADRYACRKPRTRDQVLAAITSSSTSRYSRQFRHVAAGNGFQWQLKCARRGLRCAAGA
jgi:AcrR family transcriptional regulator